MIKIIAKSKLKSDVNIEAYLKLANELVIESRKEKGCIAYSLYEDINDPTTFTMIEEWEDENAIEEHNNSEHFLKIVPELRKLREAGEINLYREVKQEFS
ncbi:putative quinol monooxygenase [Neobacillus sp. LXY-4]|uniref:putative quinol monooxygenase n=1 Tax=Neobacillus sp. LXY-4 TaxID=3379826 RepID=UPI003EE147D4